jgi:nuclear pore complex protein Nup98-Nup96
MRWQEKIEENSLKVGAKFIDYRPETGSWVFEVSLFRLKDNFITFHRV